MANNNKTVLAEYIDRYAKKDGRYQTTIPSLSFTRMSNMTEPNHGLYKTSLCIIAQGKKEALLSEESYIYGPEDYLVASVDLPVVAHIVEATPDAPYLALALEIAPNEILEVLRELPKENNKKKNTERGLFVSQMKQPLLDAIARLVQLLDNPEDVPIMAPLIKKEIIYRIITEENGERLKQVALEGSSTNQINHVIKYIMQNYEKNMKVEELAEIANVSVSSLYRYFSEVTSMSPIQYQKQLRLQKARGLLISESANAADIAFRVGYESPSQFSREYARLFGRPPKKDIQYLEDKLYENGK